MCPLFPALFPAILSLGPSMPARAADASLFLTCFIFVFYLWAMGASCGLNSQAALLENLLFLPLKAQLPPFTPLRPPGSVSSRLTARAGPRQLCRAPVFLLHLASLSLCLHCMGLVRSACPEAPSGHFTHLCSRLWHTVGVLLHNQPSVHTHSELS